MTKGAPLGHLFLYALPLLLGNWLQLAYNAVLPKASPAGLRPQARVEAQPPEAALSAETEAVRVSGLMRAELLRHPVKWLILVILPSSDPAGPPHPFRRCAPPPPVSGESVPEGKGKERRSGSWPPLFYSVKFPNIPRFRL